MPHRSPLAPLRRLSVLLLLCVCSRLAAAQNFAQPTVIPTGNWPAAVYTADLNGDGFPDLIYIDQGAQPNQPSTTHVLLNDGKGHFTQSAVIATIGNSLAIGDFLTSGTLSIAWIKPETQSECGIPATYYSYFCAVPVIAAGRGDGTFSAPQLTSYNLTAAPAKGTPGSGALAVWTYLTAVPTAGNKAPRIVAEDTTYGSLLIFTIINPATLQVGFSSEPFASLVTSGTGSYHAGPIQQVDLNGDGYPDLILQDLADHAVLALLGNTISGFPFNSADGLLTGINSAVAQDVNRDGRPDLITEGANGRLDVFFGNGDGTFQTTSSGGTGTLDGRTGNGGHLITLADLNHDGQLDALTSTPAGISSLLGQGTAYLGLKGIANAGPGMHTFATADFNGDGNLDLATDSPEGIAILYGKADGSFQTSAAYAAGQPALSGVIAPLTASGHPDATVSTGATQAQVLLGDGTGRFTAAGGAGSPAPTTPSPGLAGLWSSVLAADVNHDGNLDLVLTADGGSNPANGGTQIPATGPGAVYQLGNGDGTFQLPGSFTPGFNCPYLATQSCFYGASTLILPGGPPSSSSIIANLDQTGLTFFNQTSDLAIDFFTPELSPHAHDLLLSGIEYLFPTTNSRNQIIVKQDGSSLNVLFNADILHTRSIGDLHVDGSLTTPGQLIAPDIAATFPGPSQALGFRAFPGSGTIADLDGDGYGDILVVYANLDANRVAPAASAPNYLYIWFGSAFSGAGGQFVTTTAHPVNPVRIQLSRNYYQVAVADLNHDGIPDLILSDGYLVSVQYGKGDGTFGAETHLLAGQGINSLMLADVNGDGTMDLLTANGGAVLSNPVASLEVLATNPDVNTGGITVLLNPPAPKVTAPAGTLAVSPNPVAFEAAYTFTATLSVPAGSPAPTGQITFTVPGISGTVAVTLVNGSATLTVPAHQPGLPNAVLPGTYTATASYAGDQNYSALNNLSATLTVNRAPTSVVLTPTTPLQTFYGGPVDGTFVITVQDAAYPTTGTGTVYDNGVAVPICTMLPVTNRGTTVFCPYGNPVLLDAGTHALQVGYDGDPVNAPSISPAIPYVVSPDPTTTTGLTSSLPVAPVGQPITFSATVTGVLAVPTGTVTFFVSSLLHPLVTVLGTGTLNAAGVATFTTSSLPIGTYTITAGYGGNQDFNPSSAGPITQIVIAAPVVVASSVALTSSVNPSAPGQAITLTATVSVVTLHPPVAPGTITFYDGQTVLATQPLNSVGVASFTTSTLASGSHALTAAYGGATGVTPVVAPTPPQPPGTPRATAGLLLSISPSVSPVLTQIVNVQLQQEPIGFTITVTPAPVTLGVGRTAVLLVQVTPVSGFAQPVALSCGSLPFEATCSFGQATIPAGGGATTLNLATEAPHDCSNPDAPYFLGAEDDPTAAAKTFAAFFLPGLLALGIVRRRRLRILTRDAAVLALACLTLAATSGCGHCTDLGTRPGTYTINIVGSAQGGPVNQTQTQPLQLTTHY